MQKSLNSAKQASVWEKFNDNVVCFNRAGVNQIGSVLLKQCSAAQQ
jgi:hypothetical protein